MTYTYPDPETEKRYVSCFGHECPYCGSDNITIANHFDDSNRIECNACDKAWLEIYEITGIMEEE